MKRKELQAGWRELRDEIMAGMAEWRAQHSKATLREIKGEIDRRLSGLRTRMITDTANAGASARWEAADGVVYPECGTKSIKKGKKKRVLLMREGREYGVCPACGLGIFPWIGNWNCCRRN